MPVCQLCGDQFPNKMEIEGKIRALRNRHYCLQCSPFGTHNTRQLLPFEKTNRNIKQCVDCKKILPTEDFPIRDKKYRRSTCNNCTLIRYRRYTNDRALERKTQAVMHLGGQCQHCSKTEPVIIFDFHHLNDSNKEANISTLLCKKWEKIVPELEKCLLLCVNCHRAVHYGPTSDSKILEYRQKKQVLLEYKGGECILCGYNESPAALDFHHIDPEAKIFGIGNRPCCTLEYLKTEVDKCILVCACCHRIEHQREMDRTVT